MTVPYQIHRKVFTPWIHKECLINETKRVPPWLGNFTFGAYGPAYGKSIDKLPWGVKAFCEAVAGDYVPDQKFNTIFIQKYEVGEFVRPHRDPKNNIGKTIIAIFGEFTGAETTLYLDKPVKFTLDSGDILVLDCTIDGIQGCKHEVSKVLSGTRYAVIQNTIKVGGSDTFDDIIQYS